MSAIRPGSRSIQSKAAPPLRTQMPVLDVIRGVAALLVVAGHTRSQIEAFTGESASSLPVVWKLLLLPTSVAQESVAVFFVLSGYLVGGQVLRQASQDRFEWRSFLAKRLSRMWTVLIPGLLITALMSWVFARTYEVPRVGPATQADTSPTAYLCNVFFGQEARCTPAGSNDSLWSLSYEFWFYVIFAALVMCVGAAAKKKVRVSILNLLVGVLAVLYFTPMVFVFSISWLYGAASAHWGHGRPLHWIFSANHSVAAWTLLVGLAMTASTVLGLPRSLMFAEVGVPAAGLVLAGTVASVEAHRPRMRIGEALGRCSFTMYVIHLPLVAFCARFLTDHAIGDSVLELAVVSYLLSVVAVPVSLGFWWLFERHTGRVRDGLFRLLRVPQQTRSAATAMR